MSLLFAQARESARQKLAASTMGGLSRRMATALLSAALPRGVIRRRRIA